MFQATSQEFEAAVIVRCFVVGFRYYRQSEINKAFLAYTMTNVLQSKVFGNVKPLANLNIANVFKTITEIAKAQEIPEPEQWAGRVLLLATPMFLKRKPVRVAAGVEEIEKEELLVEFERCMSISEVDAYTISLAVAGNLRLSTSFSDLVPENYIRIYDESTLPISVPALPEVMTDWKEALALHRQNQRSLDEELAGIEALEATAETEEFDA